MKRILSGIRPTGGMHLGNYLGSLKQWVDLSREDDTECFFMVADYHALLSMRETPLDTASLDLVAWELAAGLDPDKVTLFVQSSVPPHTELAWIFSAFVTVPELNRMTQYKDLIAQGLEKPRAALFNYPLLMAADIALYKADIVPVGDDQVQHIEMARTLTERINSHTKTDVFPLPHARLTHSARIMSLHDPSVKMAKSLPQGALLLEDDETTLRDKISRAVTDTGPAIEEALDDQTFIPGARDKLLAQMSPGVRNLFIILDELTPNLVDDFLSQYRNQSLRYRDLKSVVSESVIKTVIPMKTRYNHVRANETQLRQILQQGNEKALKTAQQTLNETKKLLQFLMD